MKKKQAWTCILIGSMTHYVVLFLNLRLELQHQTIAYSIRDQEVQLIIRKLDWQTAETPSNFKTMS
jgi:hypothetical protein